MNSACRKRQRQQERASALTAILGATLLVIVATALTSALVYWIATMPAGWWLPVEARPFGGAL